MIKPEQFALTLGSASLRGWLPCRRVSKASLFSRLMPLFFALLTLSLPVRALPVEGLYSARVDGRPQDMPSDQQLYQGLSQVLVKLSGRRDIMERPEVRTLLDNAPLLLQRSEALGADSMLHFAPEQMSGLMQSLGLPLLGVDRPAVLLWVAQRNASGHADYLPADAALLAPLRAAAERRGLPLMTPLFDLDDQLALTADDLFNGVDAAIRSASQRYQAGAVLVGRVDEEQDSAMLRWSLLLPEQRVDYTLVSAAELAAMLDQVADRLLVGEPTQGAVFGAMNVGEAPTHSGQGVVGVISTVSGIAGSAVEGPMSESLSGIAPSLPPPPLDVGEFAPQGAALVVEGVRGPAEYIELMRWLRQQPGVEAVATAGFDAGLLQLRVQMRDGAGELPPLAVSATEGLIPLANGHYLWAPPMQSDVLTPAASDAPLAPY